MPGASTNQKPVLRARDQGSANERPGLPATSLINAAAVGPMTSLFNFSDLGKMAPGLLVTKLDRITIMELFSHLPDKKQLIG